MTRVTVREILAAFEVLAPSVLAESWDNVGLLIGDAAQPVTTVLTALDATPVVLDQATAVHAELLVTHHPLIFSGMKRLVEDRTTQSLVRRMIQDGRSLISLHTNLDAAPDGLNAYVAGMLGLRQLRPLLPAEGHLLLKLVVYVPEAHTEAVREAICAAGAGNIGHYGECTFSVPGTGTFRPEEGTTPYIGETGVLERVAEARLETVVPKAVLGPVLNALFAVHPYEEVAFDLLPLENAWPGAGLGRIGRLDAPTTAGQFRETVASAIGTDDLSVVGNDDHPVRTVALCTGAGGDFLPHAISAGADLYLTGELKHHQALLARQRGIAVIDAGHFATERPAVPLLAEYLQTRFPGVAVVQATEEAPLRRSR